LEKNDLNLTLFSCVREVNLWVQKGNQKLKRGVGRQKGSVGSITAGSGVTTLRKRRVWAGVWGEVGLGFNETSVAILAQNSGGWWGKKKRGNRVVAKVWSNRRRLNPPTFFWFGGKQTFKSREPSKMGLGLTLGLKK